MKIFAYAFILFGFSAVVIDAAGESEFFNGGSFLTPCGKYIPGKLDSVLAPSCTRTNSEYFACLLLHLKAVFQIFGVQYWLNWRNLQPLVRAVTPSYHSSFWRTLIQRWSAMIQSVLECYWKTLSTFLNSCCHTFNTNEHVMLSIKLESNVQNTWPNQPTEVLIWINSMNSPENIQRIWLTVSIRTWEKIEKKEIPQQRTG